MNKKPFDDLFEHIVGVGKSYYDYKIDDNEEEKAKIRKTIDEQLGVLPLDVQADFVAQLRYNSIDVNGHRPTENNGYGIIRDIYCEHLLEDVMQSAKIKLSNIQSGIFSKVSIDEKIKDQLKELENDQFEAFNLAVENYQTPTYFEQTAKNRDEYAWKEVNMLMQAVIEEKRNEVYELD